MSIFRKAASLNTLGLVRWRSRGERVERAVERSAVADERTAAAIEALAAMARVEATRNPELARRAEVARLAKAERARARRQRLRAFVVRHDVLPAETVDRALGTEEET